MIGVHQNGDITFSGKPFPLPMYRQTANPQRYEAAFDLPCPCRVFIGQFRPNRPPIAFVWKCALKDTTTSIKTCRECVVSEAEKLVWKGNNPVICSRQAPALPPEETPWRRVISGPPPE